MFILWLRLGALFGALGIVVLPQLSRDDTHWIGGHAEGKKEGQTMNGTPQDSETARVLWELHRTIDQDVALIEDCLIRGFKGDESAFRSGVKAGLRLALMEMESKIPALRGFKHCAKG